MGIEIPKNCIANYDYFTNKLTSEQQKTLLDNFDIIFLRDNYIGNFINDNKPYNEQDFIEICYFMECIEINLKTPKQLKTRAFFHMIRTKHSHKNQLNSEYNTFKSLSKKELFEIFSEFASLLNQYYYYKPYFNELNQKNEQNYKYYAKPNRQKTNDINTIEKYIEFLKRTTRKKVDRYVNIWSLEEQKKIKTEFQEQEYEFINREFENHFEMANKLLEDLKKEHFKIIPTKAYHRNTLKCNKTIFANLIHKLETQYKLSKYHLQQLLIAIDSLHHY